MTTPTHSHKAWTDKGGYATSCCKGFQRSERPAYVIDAGAMAATINATNAAAEQR